LQQFDSFRVDDRRARSKTGNKPTGVDDDPGINLPDAGKMRVPHQYVPRLRPEYPCKIGGFSRSFPPRLQNHEWTERWPELAEEELQTRPAIIR